ncbi:MAG: cobyrinate a,c-diamide synthase [Cyanosarcina radialis HA8281-LM2]|jgi:cobyrinic acid a,c-diamide synthase|nr:cobyrinate a,c-diamide synthase [Cyanosarcina radialis HA8281-LM2]
MVLAIAGERSSAGKTTVTLAMLAYLQQCGLRVQAFKVGPDYIDTMFHQYVTGLPSRNLDPVLTGESYIKECFNRHLHGVDCGLVEGVMGLFDGVSPPVIRLLSSVENKKQLTDFASTAHIARLLEIPVVLVIDCRGLSGSVAAIAHGYRTFDPRIQLAGVVLNRVGSDRHLEMLEDALESLNLPILGILRRHDEITIPDRHLGLVPTAEIPQLDAVIDRLADLGKNCFDWERLFPLLQIPSSRRSSATSLHSRIPTKIAVARDRAFNFYYQDNLDLFSQLGAELIFWSPLTDSALPAGVQGLYFGGGFPEVFASELSANRAACDAVRAAILAGMPAYAECGGLMYLSQKITDFKGESRSMVGILPTSAIMSSRLTLGYRRATARQDSPLFPAGTIVWGHEFHRSELSAMPNPPLYRIDGSSIDEGWRYVASQQATPTHQLHASYIHLHFGARPEIPARFLQHCQQWKNPLNF